MNMQNPYEDLIQTIDVILRKIEPDDGKKTVGLLITDLPTSGPEHPASRIRFLQRLKEHGAIKDFSVMNMAGTPYGFILNRPNRSKLLEERQLLVNFDQAQTAKRSAKRLSENKGPIVEHATMKFKV
jgi:hypothetical protein